MRTERSQEPMEDLVPSDADRRDPYSSSRRPLVTRMHTSEESQQCGTRLRSGRDVEHSRLQASGFRLRPLRVTPFFLFYSGPAWLHQPASCAIPTLLFPDAIAVQFFTCTRPGPVSTSNSPSPLKRTSPRLLDGRLRSEVCRCRAHRRPA